MRSDLGEGVGMGGDPESELSPQFIFMTGSVVTWCGRIEGLVAADVQRLAEEYPEFQSREEFKTVETVSDRRIAQWVRVCRLVFGGHVELIEEVLAIAAEAEDILRDRNVLVQGLWQVEGQKSANRVRILHHERANNGETEAYLTNYTVSDAMISGINQRAYKLYERLVQLDADRKFWLQSGAARLCGRTR